MAIEEANDDSFKEMLRKNDKVIVKYYANWCGSCLYSNPNIEDYQKMNASRMSFL